jgi:hypothetical protein
MFPKKVTFCPTFTMLKIKAAAIALVQLDEQPATLPPNTAPQWHRHLMMSPTSF